MSNLSKKQKVFAISAHIAVVVWMLVIYNFSAQPGEESADLSGGVSHLFMTLWNQIFGLGWDEAKVLAMTEIWDYPIRKLAHMTEFGILAILMYITLRYYAKIKTTGQRLLAAWIGAVCYAATDEFHQLFVEGRSGNLFDVCVDATGAAIALLVIYIIKRSFHGRIRQL